MNSSTRLALILGLQLAAGAAFVACGSDAKEDDGGGDETGKTPDTGGGTLQFLNSPLYSAFIEGGAHEAQVPVVLKDATLRGKGATFTSSDPSIATVVGTDEGAMVTVKNEGSVTITGSVEGDSGKVKLTIKKYTEEEWKTGQARYSKPELAINPPAGQAVSALALINPSARDPNGACNTCHTAQAKTLKIENTPTQIAGYSDDDLITIFTMGKKPDGASVKTMIPAFLWGMLHAWTVTDAEKPGLIAFLRTQQPKANPNPIDYGVQPCPGAPAPTAGMMPMLCDNDGNPINIGRPGAGADAGTGTTMPTTPDAGTDDTTTTPDAGTPTTADGDAG